MADKVSDWRATPRPEQGPSPRTWEQGSKTSTARAGSSSGVKVNRESGGGTAPSMSFAEMAKRGGGGGERTSRELENRNSGGSRQTEPCLSQVGSLSSLYPNSNYHNQVVLNQISASTYGKIGKSADVSKYVMGGRGQEEREDKPAGVNELEVEFREEEEEERSEGKSRGNFGSEDFEVEFSSAAPGPRLVCS